MNRKSMKRLPLFPFVPLVPIALVVGSLVTAVRALVCVRRLERRLDAETPAQA
jgi:hypothetical protein